MPVATTDIDVWQSVGGGTGGERDLGAPITDNEIGNLFPQITSSEAAAGGSRIRKFFISNEHATDDMLSPAASVRFYPGTYTVEVGYGVDHADDDDAGVSGNLDGDQGGADETIEAVSDGADTRDVTLIGRTLAGAHVETTETLNGTTPIVFGTDVAFVYAAVANGSDGSRTVTIRRQTGPVTIGTIQPDQRHCFWWQDQATEDPMTMNDVGPGGVRGFWIRKTWPANTFASAGIPMQFEVAYD